MSFGIVPTECACHDMSERDIQPENVADRADKVKFYGTTLISYSADKALIESILFTKHV